MKASLKQFKNVFAGFFIITALSCCHNFYKATKANTTAVAQTSASISQLKQQNRFFILRSGTKAYYMKTLSLSDDQKTLSTTLDSLPPDHKLYLKYGRKGKMLYKKNTDEAVLTEVHLFISKDSTLQTGNYSLALDKVQKIEVVEKDKQRTTGSYIIGAIGYTIGAIAVAAIILAATKSSCPFVSA